MPPPSPAVPARRGTGRRGRGFSPSLPATGSGRRRRRARRLPGFPGDLSRLVEAALHVQRFGEHSGHGAQKSLFADGPKCLVRLLKVVPGRGRVSGDLLNMTGQACAQCPSGFRSRAVMHRPGAGDRVPGVSETADVRVDHRERYQDVGFRWLRLPRFEPWTCHRQHKQPLASSSVVRLAIATGRSVVTQAPGIPRVQLN